MISGTEIETVCQWAFDVERKRYECVHGVQVEASYMHAARLSQLRGRHKTETVGVRAIFDGIQEGMSGSMFSQMLEGGATVEREWRDSEGNLHIEKTEGNSVGPD